MILIAHELFARRGDLPSGANDSWTTFEMELRDPVPIPPAFDFTRFLVSSITFMAHLREVSVYFDDKRLVHLTKDAGTPNQISIPRGLKPTSTMGFMNVKGLKSTRKRFAHHLTYSVLIVITLYSPRHHCGGHELGLQYRNREAQTSPRHRTNKTQDWVFLFSVWFEWEQHPSTGSFPVTSSTSPQ